MRKSRTINLLILGGGLVGYSLCLCSGCGRNDPPAAATPYDPPWYDATGHPIAKEWTTDADGHRTPAQPPYDANGKPIAFDADGNPVPPAGYNYTSGSSHYHRTGGWFPYIFTSRPSYGPTYRSGPTNTGSTYFGGSKPNSSSPARSSGGSSSSGSVSRGGFGGSAASVSGGS